MKILISLFATSILALSAPLAAQTMDHSQHGNTRADARKAPSRPSAKPTAKPRKAPAPSRQAPAKSDPSCPPENAAMGHCTPKPAGAAKGKPSAWLSHMNELRA